MVLEDLHCLQHLLKEADLSSHWQINLVGIVMFSCIVIIFVIIRLSLHTQTCVQQHEPLQSDH